MPTIKDVAEKACVAPSTVSFVLNRAVTSVRISESTRERVLKAIEDLNYYPNHFARSLRTRQSSTFGLITFDASDPYYVELMRGAEEVIYSKGYNFLLSDVQNDEEKLRTYLRIFAQRQVDGVLLIANSLMLQDELIMDLVEKKIPVVVIGKQIKSNEVPCVLIDNTKGTYMAVEHVIKLGHKKIGFILGPHGLVDSEQRLEGAKLALKEYKLQYDENMVEREESVDSGARPTPGYQAMDNLLGKDRVPTAVLAFDDMTAFGAIRSAQSKGLKVPDNISIVGFDDIPISAYYNPPLTTVRQPMLEMGREGAKCLFDLIEIKRGVKKRSAKNVIMMEPQLIVRESSAALTRQCDGGCSDKIK